MTFQVGDRVIVVSQSGFWYDPGGEYPRIGATGRVVGIYDPGAFQERHLEIDWDEGVDSGLGEPGVTYVLPREVEALRPDLSTPELVEAWLDG